MSDSPSTFLSDPDPFGPEARTKFRQLLADGGLVDTVDEALNPIRSVAPDGGTAWREFGERLASGYRGGYVQNPVWARGVRNRAVRGGRFKAQPLRHWIWYGGMTTVIGILGILIGWHTGAHPRFDHRVRPTSTYATTNGQRATITLLDGTTVVLGVASRLDVPGDFAMGNHQVVLAGEALFTVPRHAETPFTVLAGTTRTRVLGTSFVVRRYLNDTVTTVVVRDGKVAVDSTVVTAQHLLTVKPHHRLDLQMADPATFSFATGVLTLNATSLPDAITELDRWFDVDIRLGDPVLAKKRFVGRFTTESVAELTHLFEMVYDVRAVRVGRVITLFPKG